MSSLTCVHHIDHEPCGDEATLRFNLPLCTPHWRAYHQSALSVDSAIRQMLNYYSLDDIPGFTYFLLLPNGRIKIGLSNTPETLSQRFRDLNREIGPVVPLAVCKGNIIGERHYHGKFRAYRDYIAGSETFEYSPEIADTINELGIHPEAMEAVNSFRAYASR